MILFSSATFSSYHTFSSLKTKKSHFPIPLFYAAEWVNHWMNKWIENFMRMPRCRFAFLTLFWILTGLMVSITKYDIIYCYCRMVYTFSTIYHQQSIIENRLSTIDTWWYIGIWLSKRNSHDIEFWKYRYFIKLMIYETCLVLR